MTSSPDANETSKSRRGTTTGIRRESDDAATTICLQIDLSLPRDRHARREVLRLAVGLAPGLGAEWAAALQRAARAEGIDLAQPDLVLVEAPALGTVGRIEGKLYALGLLSFLQQRGILPPREARRAAATALAAGGIPLFLARLQPESIVGMLWLRATNSAQADTESQRGA